MSNATAEIDAGERFAFGDNWARFLSLVDDRRIQAAEESLRDNLGDIDGKTFVDVGCGSGLFSLAARNLGARVLSFDFDSASVGCAIELRRRFRADDDAWRIERGSALDRDYLASLGQFDVVYSWGVLHHTGDMWSAVGNVTELVAPGGQLFISLYNDQGMASRVWRRIKHSYVQGGPGRQRVLVCLVGAFFAFRSLPFRVYRRLRGKPRPKGVPRGMDRRRDLVDWVGGFPFEVSKPEEVFRFCRDRGFTLQELKTCAGGLGCNQYVFSR